MLSIETRCKKFFHQSLCKFLIVSLVLLFHAFRLSPASYPLPWWLRRQYALLKRLSPSTKWHGAISQKVVIVDLHVLTTCVYRFFYLSVTPKHFCVVFSFSCSHPLAVQLRYGSDSRVETVRSQRASDPLNLHLHSRLLSSSCSHVKLRFAVITCVTHKLFSPVTSYLHEIWKMSA
jgi:hypothetical protein